MMNVGCIDLPLQGMRAARNRMDDLAWGQFGDFANLEQGGNAGRPRPSRAARDDLSRGERRDSRSRVERAPRRESQAANDAILSGRKRSETTISTICCGFETAKL